MKSKVTINVESMLYEEAKAYHINISRTTEEALGTILNIKKGNLSTTGEALIKKKLERKQSSLTKLQSEVSVLRDQLNKIEDIKNKAEEEHLKDEKEKLESSKKCIKCGKILEENHKRHQFAKGTVCNGCYLSMGAQDYHKWSK